MLHLYLSWLEKAFPESGAPYSMSDIISAVRENAPSVSRSAVYRARKALLASRATADIARALNEDSGEKELLFGAPAARRIARRATRAKVGVSQLKK